MKKLKNHNGCEISLHAYLRDNRIILILELTNKTEDIITGRTPMSNWGSIKLLDKNNSSRLEPMVELAVMTDWELKPNQTLSMAQKTDKPSDMDCKNLDIRFTHDVTEAEQKNIIYFPNVSLPKEEEEKFTAIGNIKIDSVKTKIQLEFKPSDVEQLPNNFENKLNIM